MRYSTILFDFDGTLTHSLPLWMRAYQSALSNYGLNMSDEEVVETCFYKAWKDIVEQFDLPCEKEFGNHVHVVLEEVFAEAELFEGAGAVLDEIRGRGIKLGIVTSSVRPVVTKFLERNGLTDHFGVVVTADDIVNFKPHPEPVLKAIDALGGDVAHSVLIGDSEVDMMAAANSGTDKGLFFPDVHHPFYDLEILKSHDPHIVFHSYVELLTRFFPPR
ncbi:MAG: HAD family hydrolase [Cyanobacteria bacterium HKST-UBA02]|nr:HAD family hydrolase [Cyanobacteria bacterium HKST-UBA02]